MVTYIGQVYTTCQTSEKYNYLRKNLCMNNNVRLFEFCFNFAGHRSSTHEFSAGPSEFLPDLHFVCKIILKPSNVIPLLYPPQQSCRGVNWFHHVRPSVRP